MNTRGFVFNNHQRFSHFSSDDHFCNGAELFKQFDRESYKEHFCLSNLIESYKDHFCLSNLTESHTVNISVK